MESKELTIGRSRKMPKPHQVEAIQNAIKYYQEYDFGKMIQPCGAGKTLTAIWIAKALNCKRIIIVLPTLQLQGQALNSWMSDIEEDNNRALYNVIIVGSDKEIGEKYNIIPTTDSGLILSQIAENLDKPLIIITTYHSSSTIAQIAVDNKLEFDLCIFDEAHHTAGSLKKTFQSLIAMPVKIKKRLYMTATPKVLQSKGLNEAMEMFSMDDENIYGKEFYRLPTRKAIEENIICDYKVITMFSTNELVQEAIKSNSILVDKSANGLEADSRMISIAVSLVKAIKRFKLHHVIAFTSTIERSKKFQEVVRIISKTMSLEIDVFQIDNTHSDTQRDGILSNYHNSNCAIITNARLLGEGFDMPAVDATVFVDERSSATDIVQAAGRAWRNDVNKKFGYILIPCLLGKNREVLNEDFTILRRVLSALASSDDLIYNYFVDRKSVGRENFKLIDNLDLPVDFELTSFIDNLSLGIWRNIQGLNPRKGDFVSWQEACVILKRLGKYGIHNERRWIQFKKGILKINDAGEPPKNVPAMLRTVYDEYDPKLCFTNPKVNGVSVAWEIAANFTMSLGQHGITNERQWIKFRNNPSLYPNAPAVPINIPFDLRGVYKAFYHPEKFFSNGKKRSANVIAKAVYNKKNKLLSSDDKSIMKKVQSKEIITTPQITDSRLTGASNRNDQRIGIKAKPTTPSYRIPGNHLIKFLENRNRGVYKILATNYFEEINSYGVTMALELIKDQLRIDTGKEIEINYFALNSAYKKIKNSWKEKSHI